jgi:hypothetical protein
MTGPAGPCSTVDERGLLLDFAAPERCIASARSAQGADLPTLTEARLAPSFGALAAPLRALEIFAL